MTLVRAAGVAAAFTLTPAFAANPARTENLIQQMNLGEKVYLLHGNEMETHPLPRLGIPSIKMANGPAGVQWEKATSFPAPIAVSASFDPGLVRRLSKAMAMETLARGRDMLLAPCVNIARTPQGGRNFESYGEDPYLNGVFASAFVSELQARGVMASVKHFAVNDQETERMTIDVRVDERTLHEIHLPAFKAAIDAGSSSVMSAYNKVNGIHATENDYLQNQLLKNKWRYPGIVISDWDATHSTVPAAKAGLDLEMPNGLHFGKGKLEQAVAKGEISESLIDDKVRRLLRAMDEVGLFERTPSDRPDPSTVNSPAHQRLAYEAARDGMVLLKNEGALPLKKLKRLAVIGPNASEAANRGGGSSWVTPYYDISPLDGLRTRARGHIQIDYARGTPPLSEIDGAPPEFFPDGLMGEYFSNPDLDGAPAFVRLEKTIAFDWKEDSPGPGIPADAFSARWTGRLRAPAQGTYELAVRSDDGIRVYLDGKLLMSDWAAHPAYRQHVRVELEDGRDYSFRVEYLEITGHASVFVGLKEVGHSETEMRAQAVQLAAAADAAVIFAGYNEWLEGEGRDRTFALPAGQDELISAVAAANPNTIVVINSGGSVAMPWLNSVNAIVQAWYPGQEGGRAAADLLLGHAQFTGKLPVSFYRREEDSSAHGNYPGSNGQVVYGEGLFVGYRHLDSKGIEPLFPFGHGLSYTSFALQDLNVNVVSRSAAAPLIQVRVQVVNTGRLSGAEVVQLYVHPKSPLVPRPPQELKAFAKVALAAGESREVTLKLDAQAFAHYDVAGGEWTVAPGSYELRVGTSSRHLPLRGTVDLADSVRTF